MAAEIYTLLIGASIINSLRLQKTLKNVKIIAKSGLAFNSEKMLQIKKEIKETCRGKLNINIAFFPFGNSFFPGRPAGKCYLERTRPITALQMAQLTIDLLREFRALCPTNAKIKFTILPGLGRRRFKCARSCKRCICFRDFDTLLIKYENHLTKLKDEDTEVISILSISEYLKTTATKKIRKILRQTDYRLRTNKISAFRHKCKVSNIVTGMFTRCSLHRKKNTYLDKVHVCCTRMRNVLATYISVTLSAANRIV